MAQDNRGRIVIDKERCKGCGYCIMYCPKKCIEVSKDMNMRGVHYAVFVDPSECTGCTICARMCPEVCIEVFQRILSGSLYENVEKPFAEFIENSWDKLRGDKSKPKGKSEKES